jgi:two-component system chemotaxis response regulator CheB
LQCGARRWEIKTHEWIEIGNQWRGPDAILPARTDYARSIAFILRRGGVPGHDLIVIGGSAGSVGALQAIVEALPADLPATVCIVLHVAPYLPNTLPEVLQRVTALDVRVARHGAPLEYGTVYVAPSNEHLLIEPGRIRLAHGPKENRTRPAIDPLFRSAALHFGPRVIGLILSGALDDGTAGLWAVKDCGGIAVVQDPMDALVPSMPRSAITYVAVDHVYAATAIAPILTKVVRTPVQPGVVAPRADVADLEREVGIAAVDESTHWRSERYGVPSRFACPECGGVLWHARSDGPLSLRCEVGHAYSGAALAEDQTDAVERALWAALRALEDKAELATLRAANADDRGQDDVATRLRVQRDASQAHAATIRQLLRMNARSEQSPSEAAEASGLGEPPMVE